MNTKTNINVVMGKVFQYFTGSFKNNVDERVSNNNVKRILICRPSHRLGNLLLLSPLIQELECTFPNCEIDLLVKKSCAAQLYENYDTVKQVIEFPNKPLINPITCIRTLIRLRNTKYDMTINAVRESSSGRLFTNICNAKVKFTGDRDTESKERHIAKQVICSLREFLPSIGIKANDAVPACMDLRLANHELIRAGILVGDLVQNAQLIICLFTHAHGTKCYTESWWATLYEHLQKAFPYVNIIEVLPIEKVSRIGFRAPTLYSTDVRELAAIIANTDIFLGADSGVMHLASATLTPTIGLFSVTDKEKYQPYNEGSVAVETNKVQIDDLLLLVQNALYPDLNTSA